MPIPDDPRPPAEILSPDADDTALVPLRYRFDGWTAGKQRGFLAALGESGCVRDACRTVGLSSTSAYRLRARSPGFAAAWDRALAMAATVLEQVAFQRAVVGVDEPVWHGGRCVGTRRRYSDGLLRLLIVRGDLGGGKGARGGGGTRLARRATDEEVDAELERKLDVLARRLRAEARAAGVEVADRLRLAGKAP